MAGSIISKKLFDLLDVFQKLEVVLGRVSRLSRPAWANLASQGILTSLCHIGVRNLTLLDMLVLHAWRMGIGCSEAHLHPSSSPSPSPGVSTQQPSNTNLDSLEFTSSHLDSHRLASIRSDGFNFTWIQLDSLGLTQTHMDSLGFTWTHSDSRIHLDSLGFIRTQLDSLELAWACLDSHLDSFGLTC